MVATVMSSTASRTAVTKKAFTGNTVAAKSARLPVVSAAKRIECNAEKKAINKEALVAGVIAGAGAMMANPLVAEAAVTPSLKNLLNSVIAGGVVLGAIAGAVSAVSAFDPVNRK